MRDDGVGAKANSMLIRKLHSFCCSMYKILALIGEMVDVDLVKQNLCFDRDE